PRGGLQRAAGRGGAAEPGSAEPQYGHRRPGAPTDGGVGSEPRRSPGPSRPRGARRTVKGADGGARGACRVRVGGGVPDSPWGSYQSPFDLTHCPVSSTTWATPQP